MNKDKELTAEGKTRIMASNDPDYITPKQQMFVAEYLANGGHQTNAANAAGYSEKSARVTASNMMAMPKIKKRIEAAKREQMDRLAVDADWLVSRFKLEAVDDESPAAARIRALELLGKVAGIFAPEKQQIETINGGDFLASLDLSEHDDDDTVQ